MSVRRGPNKGAWILSKKMDIHGVARVGDLSALIVARLSCESVMLWLEHGHEVSMCYSVPKLEGFSPRDEGHYNHRYRMHMF